jgi:hypothetical protein
VALPAVQWKVTVEELKVDPGTELTITAGPVVGVGVGVGVGLRCSGRCRRERRGPVRSVIRVSRKRPGIVHLGEERRINGPAVGRNVVYGH